MMSLRRSRYFHVATRNYSKNYEYIQRKSANIYGISPILGVFLFVLIDFPSIITLLSKQKSYSGAPLEVFIIIFPIIYAVLALSIRV